MVILCSSKHLGDILKWTVVNRENTIKVAFNPLLFNGSEEVKNARGRKDIIGRLHFANSSHFVSSLAIPVNISATIFCNDENLTYSYMNSKYGSTSIIHQELLLCVILQDYIKEYLYELLLNYS